jgi:hypothetical protein
MPDRTVTLSCHWDPRVGRWMHFIGDRSVTADEFDAARARTRWGVKTDPRNPGVWWLTRHGHEVGSLQLTCELDRPATTVARILAALEQDGAS